jgi:hypothetical protein
LIFGVGINQLELIRETKSLDMIKILIDSSKGAFGEGVIDLFYQVKGDNYPSTKKYSFK